MDISRFINFRDKKRLALDIILLFVCGFIILFLGKLLQNYYFVFISPRIIQPSDTIKNVTFFFFLVLFFILLKILLAWIFRKEGRIYIFNGKDWPRKWIFNGKTKLTDEGLLIKSSRAGCLLKNYYWKDFKMSFEMKFSSDRCESQKRFGLFFRAEDLDNYFMIEIGENVEKCKGTLISSIKPQVRYRGGWETMSLTEIKVPFDFSNFFVKVSLEVKKDTACFFYKGTPIFRWVLPTYVDVNHIESGVKNNEGNTEKIIVSSAFSGHVQKIPFRLGYGLIGFRAHWNHTGTYVRNLKVEPL